MEESFSNSPSDNGSLSDFQSPRMPAGNQAWGNIWVSTAQIWRKAKSRQEAHITISFITYHKVPQFLSQLSAWPYNLLIKPITRPPLFNYEIFQTYRSVPKMITHTHAHVQCTNTLHLNLASENIHHLCFRSPGSVTHYTTIIISGRPVCSLSSILVPSSTVGTTIWKLVCVSPLFTFMLSFHMNT